jgi:5-(hydroxymethyl)furfural/furfural oxidase
MLPEVRRQGEASPDVTAALSGEGPVIDAPPSWLRICDASVIPSIPCANTDIPTIMVAERMVDLIAAS